MQSLAQPLTWIDAVHLIILGYGTVHAVIHFFNIVFWANDQLGRIYSYIVTDTARLEMAKRKAGL